MRFLPQNVPPNFYFLFVWQNFLFPTSETLARVSLVTWKYKPPGSSLIITKLMELNSASLGDLQNNN